jgi:hypothetical protein
MRDKPPASVELYQRFVDLVEACGPFTYAAAKTTITFKGSRRGFAGWVRDAYEVGQGWRLTRPSGS